MKNLTWQNPEQLFVAQVLINKVKSKCCGIKVFVFALCRSLAIDGNNGRCISAFSSSLRAEPELVLFLPFWALLCSLYFNCKVRHFFSNIRCTSITCTIVKSVKKIKVFYTFGVAFFHHAKMPGKKQLWGLEALFLIHFSCVPLIINTLYHFSRVVYI